MGVNSAKHQAFGVLPAFLACVAFADLFKHLPKTLVLACGLCLTAPLKVEALETTAPIGFLFVLDPDLEVGTLQKPAAASGSISTGQLASGTILFEKAADQPFAPGSLAKIMAAATVFDAIKQGALRESQICRVSVHAWRTGGAPAGRTTMFAEVKSEIPVADLLRGLVIHNANDAAIALAECIDGSESAFAKRMTSVARRIGMMDSVFVNPTGFEPETSPGANTEATDTQQPPEAWAHTTARDMARLALYLLRHHARQFGMFSEESFTWNNIYQRNKNPLLGDVRGLDGLGAGQSEKDGYSGLGTVLRDGLRFVAVTAGTPSAAARSATLKGLIDDALEVFANKRLFEAGDLVAEARVFGGLDETVALAPTRPVEVLLPRAGTLDYRIRVVYSGPLKAPVKAGTPVGELRVIGANGIVHRQPVVTQNDVARGDLQVRALSTLKEYLFGWF
ncbi:D-alanyl-D-alanine carboxypeptidase [Roseibium sp. CAU 1637]|uniref:serine-type D-Ala-D-Ala carboxypeptidase n=1 Tax=Roseibium limicola TaxID=2816037 RepID=A0A939EMA7_9HYPH|nr:D-alanyl-D-alanine carboxypeptidase family protein [Roseibium limicola]MBO0344446.1 D-alanyl-D-alanine carboxypeptidase [Roseibium limicola]